MKCPKCGTKMKPMCWAFKSAEIWYGKCPNCGEEEAPYREED